MGLAAGGTDSINVCGNHVRHRPTHNFTKTFILRTAPARTQTMSDPSSSLSKRRRIAPMSPEQEAAASTWVPSIDFGKALPHSIPPCVLSTQRFGADAGPCWHLPSIPNRAADQYPRAWPHSSYTGPRPRPRRRMSQSRTNIKVPCWPRPNPQAFLPRFRFVAMGRGPILSRCNQLMGGCICPTHWPPLPVA